ncbi:MAG: DUF998 domain-containing protein [Candidatus Krumholzibacteriia bacterium]
MSTADLSGPGNGTTRTYVRLGAAIPVVFFLTTFICGRLLGGYNHLTRMVSELGAIGTPTRWLFSAGLVVCAVLSGLFVVGLRRACRALGISAVPALIILAYTVSIAGAGLFPLPLRLHLILGMPSVLLILSPVSSLLLWRGTRGLPHIVVVSLVALGLMSLGFLAYAPGVLSGYPGLKQRFFHVGWSVWFLGLSWSFAGIPWRSTAPPDSSRQ